MSNIKILHILSSPAAGGAEVFVKDLVLNAKQAGIDAGIVFISNAQEVGRDISYEKILIEQLKQNKIPYVILPQGSRRNPFKGKKVFQGFLSTFSPNCIHSHLLSGVIYRKLFAVKTPLVYTHHSSVIETNTFVFKLVMRACTAYIGISEACSTFLNLYLPSGKTCHTIYNAVDDSRLRMPAELPLQKHKSRSLLLAVGRISAEKNYFLLLDSLLQVKQTLGNVCLLQIAGEGNQQLLTELKNYVKDNALTGMVEFIGNRSDIPHFLHAADIFVMSSNYEGLPIALLEAQLVGLPAIITDVGGCKEVLDKTEGGILVPPGSASSISDALILLLKNDPVRESMGRRAKRNSSVFSIQTCLHQHKLLYQSLI